MTAFFVLLCRQSAKLNWFCFHSGTRPKLSYWSDNKKVNLSYHFQQFPKSCLISPVCCYEMFWGQGPFACTSFLTILCPFILPSSDLPHFFSPLLFLFLLSVLFFTSVLYVRTLVRYTRSFHSFVHQPQRGSDELFTPNGTTTNPLASTFGGGDSPINDAKKVTRVLFFFFLNISPVNLSLSCLFLCVLRC